MPLNPGPVWDFLSFSISCFTILRIFLRLTTAAAAPPIASGAAPGSGMPIAPISRKGLTPLIPSAARVLKYASGPPESFIPNYITAEGADHIFEDKCGLEGWYTLHRMARHTSSSFGIRGLGQITIHSGNDPEDLVVALQALVGQQAGRNMLDEGLKGALGLLHELQALLGLPELLRYRVQDDARLRLAESLDPPEYPGQARSTHPTDAERQESGLRRLFLRGFNGKLAIQLPFRRLY